MTRKFILPTLIAHLLVLLRFMRRECYCEDCHYTWPQESDGRDGDSAGKGRQSSRYLRHLDV